MENIHFLIPLFFLTALVYSTAGLGGGSSYLALLALFFFPYASMPKMALICNLIVVSGGSWLFYRAGYFSWKRIFPFIVSSIPMSYLGGMIPVSKKLFTLLLGISLLAAAFRLLISEKAFSPSLSLSWKKSWIIGIPVGALLGFISGLVGIGGGIYLSPLLMLMGWADSKQAAASASFFILVNSLAGFAGQLTKGAWLVEWDLIFPLAIAVLLGGQIGSRLGAGKIPKLVLQRITAGLVLFVSIRLLVSLV